MHLRSRRSRNFSPISLLNDDLLDLIFNRVTESDDRKSVSEVCKQWLKVEGLTRTSVRFSDLDYLPRFPNLVTFETTSKCISKTHVEFLGQTCPKIEVINFNSPVFLSNLLALSKLSKVSLRRRRFIDEAVWFNKAQNLTYLDLGHCFQGDGFLKALIGASRNSSDVENCWGITDDSLALLANGASSKTLKKLVLACCSSITDYGVSLLREMCCLEELNLESCGDKVTNVGVLAISGIQTLKKLNLSWLRNVSDQSINCCSG